MENADRLRQMISALKDNLETRFGTWQGDLEKTVAAHGYKGYFCYYTGGDFENPGYTGYEPDKEALVETIECSLDFLWAVDLASGKGVKYTKKVKVTLVEEVPTP